MFMFILIATNALGGSSGTKRQRYISIVCQDAVAVIWDIVICVNIVANMHMQPIWLHD